MDEKDFELLLMLGKTENITHAAEKLYISQSALSKRLAAVEKELGTSLFVRTRSGIHVTPAGEIVLATLQPVTRQLRTMREQLALAQHVITGRLKAGISLNYATFRLADTLSAYQQKYPQVQMHVVTGDSRDLYQQLLRGDIDLGILRGDFPWNGPKRLLAQEPVYAIRGANTAAFPYKSLPYLGRQTDLTFSHQVTRWLRENQLQPGTTATYVDNLMTCVQMVANGSGWTVVPGICLDHFQGDKQPLTFRDGTKFTRSTWLMCTSAALELPQVRTFSQFVSRVEHAEPVEN